MTRLPKMCIKGVLKTTQESDLDFFVKIGDTTLDELISHLGGKRCTITLEGDGIMLCLGGKLDIYCYDNYYEELLNDWVISKVIMDRKYQAALNNVPLNRQLCKSLQHPVKGKEYNRGWCTISVNVR